MGQFLPISQSRHAFFQITFSLILRVDSGGDLNRRKCSAREDTQMLRERAKSIIAALELELVNQCRFEAKNKYP